MGRVKPAWFYQRKATAAEAREDYLRNNPPAPPTGAIEQRGASTDLFYRSLTLTDGTNPLIFQVSVPDDTLQLLSATQLGLLEALGVDDVALRLRGSGIKPSRVHWYAGAATPTRSRTAWGTSVVKYYDDRVYSAPFSQRVGTFSAQDLRTNFDALFAPGGTERALLGARNGRAWLDLEASPMAYTT